MRYRPDGEAVGRLLVAGALGEERKGCLRPLHLLAEELAQQAWDVLLFDYRGTGESPGHFSDIRWRGLQEDIAAAADALFGAGDTILRAMLGVRLGARLALEMSPRLNVPHLCLWAPCLSGASWWRETNRRSLFRGTASTSADMMRGLVDVDGYAFGARFVEELLELHAIPESCPTGRIHVLQVGHQEELTRRGSDLVSSLGAQATGLAVRQAPFWLETDAVAATPLVEATCGCLTELRRTCDG